MDRGCCTWCWVRPHVPSICWVLVGVGEHTLPGMGVDRSLLASFPPVSLWDQRLEDLTLKKVSIFVWWLLRSGPRGTWSILFFTLPGLRLYRRPWNVCGQTWVFFKCTFQHGLYTDYHQFWYWSLWLVDEFYPQLWDFLAEFKCWDDGPVGRFDLIKPGHSQRIVYLTKYGVLWTHLGGFSSFVFTIHCWWFSAYTMLQ